MVPYPAQGGYQPYPTFTIEARDKATNTVLATTRMVAPVSTEMGCKTCHGGGWRKGTAGISAATAQDILTMHDRFSKTNLLALAKAGKPVLCQSCHPDPMLNAPGKAGLLNLSASIHGFHANFLGGRGAEACALCHPSSPQGATRFLRGVHHDAGLDCTNCHGALEDHALALLLAEKNGGQARGHAADAAPQTKDAAGLAGIQPRTPWLQQPDCLTCHVNFGPPEADSAFSVWTAGADTLYRNRRDDSGSIHCAACHGSPHAEYPASNPYEKERDNFGPRQYQSNPYPLGANRNCKVCHTIDMDHGPAPPQFPGHDAQYPGVATTRSPTQFSPLFPGAPLFMTKEWGAAVLAGISSASSLAPLSQNEKPAHADLLQKPIKSRTKSLGSIILLYSLKKILTS